MHTIYSCSAHDAAFPDPKTTLDFGGTPTCFVRIMSLLSNCFSEGEASLLSLCSAVCPQLPKLGAFRRCLLTPQTRQRGVLSIVGVLSRAFGPAGLRSVTLSVSPARCSGSRQVLMCKILAFAKGGIYKSLGEAAKRVGFSILFPSPPLRPEKGHRGEGLSGSCRPEHQNAP